MNRRTTGIMLSQAIDGFVKYKVVEGLSENTLISYQDHLHRFLEYLDNIPINEVRSSQIEDFFFWLRTEYVPHRISGNQKSLAQKTIYNIWVTLKSFFNWALSHEFVGESPLRNIPRPKFTVKPVRPLAKREIEGLLNACKYSALAETRSRSRFKMTRPTYWRDRTIILFLLDTGVRSSELCSLKIGDVDPKTGEVMIQHGKEGGAKGAKGRTVYIGKSTRKSVWRYLVEKGNDHDESDYLFTTKQNGPLNKNSLRLLITRLGKKVGLKKCHPQLFGNANSFL